MHELSVTESILKIVLRHAATANARRVTDIHMVIGQLASIVDDSVQFYWDIISKDTIAEGAKLHFRRIPAEMFCTECEKRYTPGDGDFACPDCGGEKVRVETGTEFSLEAIDVDSYPNLEETENA